MRRLLRRCVLVFVFVGIFGCFGATRGGERGKAALDEITTVTLVNMPLKDVAAYFSKAHKSGVRDRGRSAERPADHWCNSSAEVARGAGDFTQAVEIDFSGGWRPNRH